LKKPYTRQSFFKIMGPDRKIILEIFSDRIYLEGVKEKLDFITAYK